MAPRNGGGATEIYTDAEREKILETVRRAPSVATEGSNNWSLSGIQRYLRSQGGMPNISTYTIRQVWHESGWSWLKDRSWYRTGQVTRQRKSGRVTVTDVDARAKKP